MQRWQALNILAQCNIAAGEDFHTLNSDKVEALLAEADRLHYRKPRNANGSRGRYFHAMLVRAASRDE